MTNNAGSREASHVPVQEMGDRNTVGRTTTLGQEVDDNVGLGAVQEVDDNVGLGAVQEIGGSAGLGAVQEVGGSAGLGAVQEIGGSAEVLCTSLNVRY
ncbi:hypothetical protein LSAT2_030732, partial [Lamellibrachia satsuma]